MTCFWTLEQVESRYAKALAGLDPEQAADAVRRQTGDHSLAERIAFRVFVDLVPALGGSELAKAAHELAGPEPFARR